MSTNRITNKAEFEASKGCGFHAYVDGILIDRVVAVDFDAGHVTRYITHERFERLILAGLSSQLHGVPKDVYGKIELEPIHG